MREAASEEVRECGRLMFGVITVEEFSFFKISPAARELEQWLAGCPRRLGGGPGVLVTDLTEKRDRQRQKQTDIKPERVSN